jgi:hypothetical protein
LQQRVTVGELAVLQRYLTPVLIGLGLLTCFILAFPDIVLVGFALLVIPGLVLWAVPPTLVYAATATLVFRGLARSPKWCRVVGATLAVGTLAIAPPLIVNSRTESRAESWTSGDIPLTGNTAPTNTIALLLPAILEDTVDGKATTACEELCQRLLYNRAFERVIVGLVGEGASLEFPRQSDLVAYHVERRESCPVASLGSSWLGDFESSGKAVSARIAVGQCLIKDIASLDDAQWILVHRMVYKLRWREASSGWSLTPIIYGVKRLELFARSNAGLQEVLRRTEVATSKLAIPFVMGATEFHFPFPASTGLWRKVEFVNKYSLGEQGRLIFGNGAKPIRN